MSEYSQTRAQLKLSPWSKGENIWVYHPQQLVHLGGLFIFFFSSSGGRNEKILNAEEETQSKSSKRSVR
jgi:hypothetical protein